MGLNKWTVYADYIVTNIRWSLTTRVMAQQNKSIFVVIKISQTKYFIFFRLRRDCCLFWSQHKHLVSQQRQTHGMQPAVLLCPEGPFQCQFYSATHTYTPVYRQTQRTWSGSRGKEGCDAEIPVRWYLPLLTICEGHLSPALARLSINHSGIGMMSIHGGSYCLQSFHSPHLLSVTGSRGRCVP